MMDNQTEMPPLACCSPKSKLICVSAGLVILVIVAAASFVLGRALPRGPEGTLRGTPTIAVLPTSIPTPDETADWKTYTNIEYGYQINFPSQVDKRPIYDFEKNKESVSMGVPNSDAIVIDIKVMKNLSKISIKNWWTESFGDIYGKAISDETIASQKDFLTEEKIVNSFRALRVNSLPPACNSLRYIGDQYFFSKNNYVVWVNFYHDPINCKYIGLQLGEKLKAQILSTFKFLD